MLSPVDIESLISNKRLELEKEKASLGLLSREISNNLGAENNRDSEDVGVANPSYQKPLFASDRVQGEHHATFREDKEQDKSTEDNLEENIAPQLEKYIRRYLGLPVMLKAGEFSPNNPLVLGARSATGDALRGLGEYERRRNALRRLRQMQYREYLDQQAQKKQELKEQAEKERREIEERDAAHEQKERERERREKEIEDRERERRGRDVRLANERRSPERRRGSFNYASSYQHNVNRVDTAVQVDSVNAPLSVAVQTDDADFLPMSRSKYQLTQAERELSPHTVQSPRETCGDDFSNRRRSCGDGGERPLPIKTNRDRLTADLRHSYMPSIFDAEAIQQRNVQAEKEAAERRQYYQQELRNQILEQQRIREERKSREKMLEQAEMRRLEEQLRMLKAAQDTEVGKQRELDDAVRKNSVDYDTKRTELQREIESEQRNLILGSKTRLSPKRIQSRTEDSRLPIYCPKIQEREKKPYSINIPDNSIFSHTYDVDSYLRRNLNYREKNDISKEKIIETLYENPRMKQKELKTQDPIDTLPIPVLRHSPLLQAGKVENNMSDAMKKVEDKWKVPVVQKNILKSMPNEEGRSVSILTQLGSIRRQLQLEQLRLDRMGTDDV